MAPYFWPPKIARSRGGLDSFWLVHDFFHFQSLCHAWRCTLDEIAHAMTEECGPHRGEDGDSVAGHIGLSREHQRVYALSADIELMDSDPRVDGDHVARNLVSFHHLRTSEGLFEELEMMKFAG